MPLGGTTVYIKSDLIPYIDRVKIKRRDASRSHTARLLIREALEARGELTDERAHDMNENQAESPARGPANATR